MGRSNGERDLRIPTTPEKLTAGRAQAAGPRPEMALPHDLVSAADDVSAVTR